jgi:serine/threonine-protein kinase RsbW
MAQRSIKLAIPSVIDNVGLVGIAVNGIGREAGLTEQGAFETELCVVEAVNNAILHANRGRSVREIEVRLDVGAHAVRVKICDSGSAIPAKSLDAGHFHESTELPTSGRGLRIIQTLMDHVTYARSDGKNVLSMTRRIDGSSRRSDLKEDKS